MLVSIVGSPSSGKTTTASKVFAWMKDRGMLAEFITEQARMYIAWKRVFLGRDQVSLTDMDQLTIMSTQIDIEWLMKQSVGEDDAYVISDSSALNALMYMTPQFRETREVKELTAKALKLYDLVFYAEPLKLFIEGDPNRLHNKAFSEEFDRTVDPLIESLGLSFAARLSGTSEQRTQMMLNRILWGE